MTGLVTGADGRAKAYRPLPEEARRTAREEGIAAYEAGRFWHAHELLEPAWMGSAVPAERDLDQGLIKLAAAYVHAERGNAMGMRKNLLGARRLLAAVVGEQGEAGQRAARSAGVDLPLLLERVEKALADLERVSSEDTDPRRPSARETALLSLIPPPAIPRIEGRPR